MPVTTPSRMMSLAVCRVVAVEALPVRAAVIVPAAKLPEESRLTTVDTVFLYLRLSCCPEGQHSNC